MERVFQLFPDIKKAEKWIENNNKEFQLFPRKPPIFQVKSKTLEKINGILQKEMENFLIEKEEQIYHKFLSYEFTKWKDFILFNMFLCICYICYKSLIYGKIWI